MIRLLLGFLVLVAPLDARAQTNCVSLVGQDLNCNTIDVEDELPVDTNDPVCAAWT
ncbi:MAG: hypothetical protein JRJ84_13605, partial [Deltaproteobacteria bacterium]|nr:hypothetical protein [Deltaproteobacteria bacterium]